MNSPFDNVDFATFSAADIDGKVLRIISVTSEGVTLIAGQDVVDGKIYVIKSEKET